MESQDRIPHFRAPVHIVSFDPGGEPVDASENARRHRVFSQEMSDLTLLRTVATSPGANPRPGRAILGIGVDDARDLARRFDQRAILRWTESTLSVVVVDGSQTTSLGWRLAALDAVALPDAHFV